MSRSRSFISGVRAGLLFSLLVGVVRVMQFGALHRQSPALPSSETRCDDKAAAAPLPLPPLPPLPLPVVPLPQPAAALLPAPPPLSTGAETCSPRPLQLGRHFCVDYIAERINAMAPHWQRAAKEAAATSTPAVPCKKVALFLGLVAFYHMSGQAGSPRGDLAQWADLIAALTMQGHDVEVICTEADYNAFLASDASARFDLIFADLRSLQHFRHPAINSWPLRIGGKPANCRVRVIDFYGTDAPYHKLLEDPSDPDDDDTGEFFLHDIV